eukprot:XP_011665940.1 PREDICTED: UPF0739 protein C1orf74 homolog [Strongylocentrotus purpuratus]
MFRMDFRKQVSFYLGKTAGRRWKDIISDIIAVIGGIKPCFLYDYSTCDSKSLDKLAAELESMCNSKCQPKKVEHSTSVEIDNGRVDKQDSTVNSGIRTTGVLNVKDDIFVINKQIMRRKLAQFVSKLTDEYARSEQNNLSERVCTFIDVSGKLPNPTLADRKITEEMMIISKDILRQVEAGFADPRHSSGDLILTLQLEDDWNVSTIFGLLLGYPVLYWYQVDIQDNCLAHTPLHVFKCKCDCVVKPFTSDSVNVGTSCTIFENGNHVIYSFSIPSSLLDYASKLISEWKDYIYHVVGLCEYFTSVSFECSTVTLPAVAL